MINSTLHFSLLEYNNTHPGIDIDSFFPADCKPLVINSNRTELHHRLLLAVARLLKQRLKERASKGLSVPQLIYQTLALNHNGCLEATQPDFSIRESPYPVKGWSDASTIDAVFAEVGLENVWVLDTSLPSQHRVDAHVGGKDCTHYCQTSVPAASADALLRRIWDDCQASTQS